jgi:histone acetyltransferase 1
VILRFEGGILGGKMFNGKDELEEFICPAETAVEMKFVKNEEDFFNNDLVFHPTFTHQIFDNEMIFGYKNLKIKLYYISDWLDVHINISFDEKVDPNSHKGAKANDVYGTLLECIPEDYVITNQDVFLSNLVERQTFKPHGELLHVHTDNERKTYEIYKVDIVTSSFKEYYTKLQTFALWFIDAASFIDIDDAQWTFYLIYEKYQCNDSPQESTYRIVGYTTVYLFYAYPDMIRPKISQMLIFPLYQRRGLGGKYIQCGPQ